MKKRCTFQHIFFLILTCTPATSSLLHAQTPANILSELKTINDSVSKVPCDKGRGNVISARGMNLFLAGKIGSYLSEGDDLSFYKNNITLNTADGLLTVNHSLFQASGLDEPVKKFMVVGVKANIANGFASAFAGKRFSNEFGFSLRQTWMGKVNTYFGPCNSTSDGQKRAMDILRGALLHSLEIEISKKSDDYKKASAEIDSTDVPGQDINTARVVAYKNFSKDLEGEYSRKYADLQAQALLNTNNYNLISTSWTSISGYIPLIAQRFMIATSLNSPFNLKRAYPLSVSVSHTRFWESTKFGRLFLTLGGEAYLNNSKRSQGLQMVSYEQYKVLGGIDTLNVAKLNSTDLYLGNYNTFVTPLVRGKIVYVPVNWHFGITIVLEKNFGSYKALNSMLGVPIVLIDKHSNPSVNLEFQVRYFDMSNEVYPDKKIGAKTSVALAIGIPFSKIIY